MLTPHAEKEEHSFTDSHQRELYYFGYHLYQDKQYQAALVCFRLLTVGDALHERAWKGMGACLHMLQDFKEAHFCYRTALSLQGNRPDPSLVLLIAECCFALDLIDQGLKALGEVKKLSRILKNDKLYDHASLMESTWSRQ